MEGSAPQQINVVEQNGILAEVLIQKVVLGLSRRCGARAARGGTLVRFLSTRRHDNRLILGLGLKFGICGGLSVGCRRCVRGHG